MKDTGMELKTFSDEEIEGMPVNEHSVEQNLRTIIKKINKENKKVDGHFITRKTFRHVLILNERRIDPIKIKEWMREYLDGQSITVWDGGAYEYHFFFEHDYDAMGFKLMWEEED